MLLSAVSILVVAQLSSEIPEELMNNPVYTVVVHTVTHNYTVQVKQHILAYFASHHNHQVLI
jgi:hypothetical protein